eukprot:7917930-Pyramimonas_sp.AAC.2
MEYLKPFGLERVLREQGSFRTLQVNPSVRRVNPSVKRVNPSVRRVNPSLRRIYPSVRRVTLEVPPPKPQDAKALTRRNGGRWRCRPTRCGSWRYPKALRPP